MATGSELVTNGSFDTDTSGWTAVSPVILSWSADGMIVNRNGGGFFQQAGMPINLVAGKTYLLSFTNRVAVSGAFAGIEITNTSRTTALYLVGTFRFSAVGTYSTTFTATTTESALIIAGVSGATTGTVTLDNISLKELTAIDTCTMFQDSLGTTPVTAVGQPVGRILDRRITTNSTIFTDNCDSFAGWTNIIGTGTSVGGRIRITRPSDNNIGRASKPITCVVGNTYKLTMERYNGTTSNTSSSVGIAISQTSIAGALIDSSITTQGRYTAFFTATQTTHWIFLMTTTGANIGDYCEFDNIVVTEQLGTHAIQSTAINRPTLQVDLNGNYYLSANGTNSTMSTASNLDMSASDKVMVLAGIRKNTSTDGVIAELSSTQVTFAGTFQLRSSLLGNPTYYFGSRGTLGAQAVITSSNYGANTSNVLCGQGDISAPLVRVRVNSGAEELTSVLTQGTGNYGSYPMFLFGRNGNSPYFNGRLYGLIVRGTATTDSIRAKAEKYMTKETLLTTTPMLDGITSGVALSLRKVYSNYTGPCLRVRNSSTNVETDIGFAEDGWIDQSALLSATGANSGFVVTWYDQSGGGRNATQTSASLQPLIVLNGVVQLVDGRPAVVASNAGAGMNVVPTGMVRNTGGATMQCVFRYASGTVQGNTSVVFASTGSGATSTRFAVMVSPTGGVADPTKLGAGVRRLDADSYFAISGSRDMSSLVSNNNICTTVMDYSTATINQWINRNTNIVNGTAQTVGVTSDTDPLAIILFSRSGTNLPANVTISEVIIYNQILTTEQRTSIEGNQSTAFNIA